MWTRNPTAIIKYQIKKTRKTNMYLQMKKIIGSSKVYSMNKSMRLEVDILVKIYKQIEYCNKR